MKILFDTNVWLAALLTRGVCAELVEHCIGTHTLLVSRGILTEIGEKISAKFHFPEKRIREALAFIRKNTTLIETSPLDSPVCRDPDDDHILAACKSGSAQCLVTGDDDLLILEHFEGVPIIKPARFWEFEKRFQ